MVEFEVGDRVVYTGSRTPFLINQEGVITLVRYSSVIVNWDNPQPQAALMTSSCNISKVLPIIKYDPEQMLAEEDDL